MPIYAVHAPQAPGASTDVADRVVFVREGFSKAAFVFGPLWLVWSRLWRALLGWLVAMIVIGALVALLRLPPATALALQGLVNLWLGFEAASLRSAALIRGGRPLVDVVASEDEDAGARIFFRRWLETRAPAASETSAPAGEAA